MNKYSIHEETTDGTLHDAFFSVSRKAAAIRMIKRFAKDPGFDVVRYVVCDTTDDGMTVATAEVKKQ